MKQESIAESNARYIEKYGKLDYDMVRNNIKVLSYNESPFSSLYYGGLSHDDLIGFSKAIFNRYPVIKKRMTSKYQFIFIDEYQDPFLAKIAGILKHIMIKKRSLIA